MQSELDAMKSQMDDIIKLYVEKIETLNGRIKELKKERSEWRDRFFDLLKW